MSVRASLVCLAAFVASSCTSPADEREAPQLEVVLHGDTVRLSLALNALDAPILLQSDLTIEDLPFPTDVAATPGGGFAVLDRLDRTLSFYRADGTPAGRAGREGEGPGEYVEPYAVATSGEYLAVWDKNGRLTTLRADRSVAGTTTIEGDLHVAWQRVPTTQWEEPLQLSREDVTRRISALPGGAFGLMVQDRDERFDSVFVRSGAPARFEHAVVVVDSLGSVIDTLLTLPGQELRLAHMPTERTWALAWERPFPLRPLWTSGAGWYARSHGSRSSVVVDFTTGSILTVEWPRDDRPLADPDYHHYIDWEIEGYRRTRGERVVREAEDIPRDVWIEDELAVSDERPQIVGMLGDGRCLALAGFRPEQGPHGEATVWLLVDLDDPTHPVAVDLGPEAGFVRTLSRAGFYTIEVGDDGLRRVHRFPLPPGACGAGEPGA